MRYDFADRLAETDATGKERSHAGMILDNYVIRIYRRDRADPRLMVGIVEEVGSRKKRGFNTFEELREILTSPTGRFMRNKHMKDRRKSTPGGI